VLLEVLLIALGRKAQSAIEKLVQQAQQFHLTVNVDRAAHEALTLQEFPQMFLGHGNCPAEVGKRNPLRSAALTDFKITLLDVVARLGEQPFAQVPQNVVDSSLQFLDRDFVQVGGARGPFEFRDQLGREFVGMTFNQSYQL
jgi:hypothetical protein